MLAALAAQDPSLHEARSLRHEVEAHPSRLRDLYELGDISRPEYEAKRAALRREAERSDARQTLAHPQVLRRLRDYLREVPAAWRDASAAQRQKLARTLFEEIVVEDDRVVGAIPQEPYRPFFVLGLDEHPGPAPETCGVADQGALRSGLEGPSTQIFKPAAPVPPLPDTLPAARVLFYPGFGPGHRQGAAAWAPRPKTTWARSGYDCQSAA